jgi:hypothetical protein
MSVIQVDIYISADEYVRSYAGTAKDVITRAHDGRNVRFPANILRPFVTHDGIKGRFHIYFTPDNKFERIEKVA